ncbi:MAG TPA: hypothetical protein VLF17_00670, partial [Candidatus Nitrosotenuis sp.]|nr:hypothetical protein [Candidatus Nitrosotenuis sp.]
YKIEERIGSSFKTISDNAGLSTTYLISSLATGKPHTYVVSAVFGLGSSPRSNDASATPTSASVPPAGYSAAPPKPQPQTTPKTTRNDPNAALKEQQSELQKKIDQAKEDLKKRPGKEDSAKAISAREEANKANEKARQEAAAKRQQAMAAKLEQLKANKNKPAGQTTSTPEKMNPRDAYTKTVNDARAAYEKVANDPSSTSKQKTDAKAAYTKAKADAKAALNQALAK